MTGGNRITLALLIGLGGILVAAGVIFYTRFWAPNRKLMDPEWFATASDAKRLEVAHQVLAWPWGNHHDAFLIVRELGGPESVPRLIRALRWQPDGPAVPCTKSHCLDALRHITGVDAGDSYVEWNRWWDSVAHQVPPRPTTQPASAPMP